MGDQEQGWDKVAELVADAKIGMLTTMTADGRHVSRPMGLQEAPFDGDLWFFAYRDSDLVRQVTTHPQVNVSFANPKQSEWTSIAGTAGVVEDREKADELWSTWLNVWFEDGVDSPGLVLLRVRADSAEYWDAPGSKVRQLIGAVRAAVTNDPEKFPAENEQVTPRD